MDDLNTTMEEYIRLEEEKARRRGKVFNWETAKYGKIWYDEDVHDLRSVKTEFLAIVFNDTLTFKATLSCEPMVSSLNDNKIDFRISFDESYDEDYMVIYDENSFSYKIISVNNLKTDFKDDNDKVNMPSLPSPEPEYIAHLPDLNLQSFNRCSLVSMAASVEAQISLIKLEFSLCLFADSLINLLRIMELCCMAANPSDVSVILDLDVPHL
ncbi:hypothetical protein Tco_0657898 [Tanacetum coccineum]